MLRGSRQPGPRPRPFDAIIPSLRLSLGPLPLAGAPTPLEKGREVRPLSGPGLPPSRGKDLSLPPSSIKCHSRYPAAGNSSGIFRRRVALKFLSSGFPLHPSASSSLGSSTDSLTRPVPRSPSEDSTFFFFVGSSVDSGGVEWERASSLCLYSRVSSQPGPLS